jgi:hypothetical protein
VAVIGEGLGMSHPLSLIVPAAGESLSLGGTGELRIGQRCVFLTLPNGTRLLPLWHTSQVGWEPQSRTISFAGADGQTIVLRQGSRVSLGGESLTDGVSRGDGFWVRRPASNCKGEKFIVDRVTLEPKS